MMASLGALRSLNPCSPVEVADAHLSRKLSRTLWLASSVRTELSAAVLDMCPDSCGCCQLGHPRPLGSSAAEDDF